MMNDQTELQIDELKHQLKKAIEAQERLNSILSRGIYDNQSERLAESLQGTVKPSDVLCPGELVFWEGVIK